MIRTEHQANEMRRHQTDEADRSRGRHAGCSQNRADQEHAHAQAFHRRAEHAGLQLAPREQIEMTCERKSQDERDCEDREERTGSAAQG
jgi:hypothetical protein